MGFFGLFRRAAVCTPYELGFRAGWRDGEYRNLKKASENPFVPGTAEHDEWATGFGQGIQESEAIIENAMKNLL